MIRSLALLLLFGHAVWAAPAPDARSLVRECIGRLQESGKKLADYGYIRRREHKEFDSSGSVKTNRSWVVKREPLDGFMVFRLIERDGTPIPEQERLKNEEILRKRLDELRAMTPEQVQKRREDIRRKESEEDAWIKEVPEALDYKPAGEEIIDGRPALVFDCSPRPGYKPKNLRARIFEKTRGRIWIDKAEPELVRADVEVFDAVTIGWGLLGRIDKGTRFFIQRKKVAPDTWFTETENARFAARVMLVKSMNTEITTRYSGFLHRSEARAAASHQ